MSLSNTTTSTYGTLRYASKPRGPTCCPLSQLAENLKQLIYFDTKRTVQRKDGSFYSKREVRRQKGLKALKSHYSTKELHLKLHMHARNV